MVLIVPITTSRVKGEGFSVFCEVTLIELLVKV